MTGRSILWQRSTGIGLDRCTLDAAGDGWRIAGTTLLWLDSAPVEVRYTLITDGSWRVRTLGATVRGPGGDRRMALAVDAHANWSGTDQPLPDLEGAVDVELGWTPAATTSTLRRLQLAPGDRGRSHAAMIALPPSEVEPALIEYHRISPDRYERTLDGASNEFGIDEHGFVTDDGSGWVMVSA